MPVAAHGSTGFFFCTLCTLEFMGFNLKMIGDFIFTLTNFLLTVLQFRTGMLVVEKNSVYVLTLFLSLFLL